MMYFEDRLRVYEKKKEQIYRDTINYSEFSISLKDIDEIDNIYSLFTMYKNGVIGRLKKDFFEKLEKLDTKLTKDQLLKLLDQVNL